MFPQALEAFDMLPPGPFDQGYSGSLSRSIAFAFGGDKAKAKAELDKISKEDRLMLPYKLAEVYVGLNAFDEALRQLELAYDTHALSMIFLMTDPILDPIRNEPRFKTLSRKMNFN